MPRSKRRHDRKFRAEEHIVGLDADTCRLVERVQELKLQLRDAKIQLQEVMGDAMSSSSSSSSSVSSLDEDGYFVDFAGHACMRPRLWAQHLHIARDRPDASEFNENGPSLSPEGVPSDGLSPPEDQQIDIGHRRDDYLRELGHLQVELCKLQAWVVQTGAKICIVFEGRDTAGKGGVIREISETLNPRVCRVVALTAPSEREKTQWYFQRYSAHLPAAGEIVLFDRSWYNRAGVEKVMGFCSDEEYNDFLQECPVFEKMLKNSGITLRKYWLDITQDVQDVRLGARIRNPTKRWKLSKMDLLSRKRWSDYTAARDRMFDATHRPQQGAAWYVVQANSHALSRLNLIHHFLSSIDYWECPHDLPADLEPLERQEEIDICKVEVPTTYETVPPVYFRGEIQDNELGRTRLAKTGGLSP